MRILKVEPFEVAGAAGTLRGTAYLPAPRPGTASPALMLLHGFGGSRIESGLFVELARTLAREGVTVFTFDRTGHGESDGSFFDVTLARDVDDAERVLKYVMSRPDVDRGNVHCAGLSMGAVITTVLAARHPELRSISLLSIAASFADEIRSGKLQGMSLDAMETRGYLDFYGRRLGPAIVRESQTTDPYALAQGYTGPVRLLHGTADFIPIEYARRYREIYGDQLFMTERPGANHGWTKVDDREFAIAEVARFVVDNAGGVRAR